MKLSPELVRAAIAGLPEGPSPWLPLLRPDARPAAVAVPLRFAEEPSVIMILRASHLREHAGQVAFPGGKVEPQDPDLLATALREMEEEIGVGRAYVSSLGHLTPTPVYGGRYLIHPFVVTVPADAAPSVCSPEIARVLAVPLVAFLRGEAPILGVAVPGPTGGGFLIPHFVIDGCALYGASAVILYELLARIAGALGTSLPQMVMQTEMPWGDREPS